MALQLAIETASGLSLPMAYSKVGFFSGNKEGITAVIHTYVNKEARDGGKTPLFEKHIQLPYVEDTAMLPAVYTLLKALPEFEHATDI